MTALVTIAAVASLVSLLLTPAVMCLAWRLDLVDRPDCHRKLHKRAVPLGGGIAVLVGATLSLTVALGMGNPWRHVLQEDGVFLKALLMSAVVICAVGLVDDWVGLRGRQKLAGQITAVGILVASGMLTHSVEIFGWKMDLGPVAVPFTACWMLGAINALNLLDGVDGLATTIGIILSLALACLALPTGHPTDAVVALVMAGSLTGFLVYNFPPARIFLGDTGSMLIGLVVGAIAIRSSLKGPATMALAAPTAILAIPFLDVVMAILRRKLTGRSLYTPDRAHLHHRLQQLGLSVSKTVAWIGCLCAFTAVGALASVKYDNEFMAVAGAAIVVGTLIVMRIFGHTECLLLTRHVINLLSSLTLRRGKPAEHSRQSCAHLQGARQWDKPWKMLIQFAEQSKMTRVQLNVHVPPLHEEYHAHWEWKRPFPDEELWQAEFPLIVHDTIVGHVKMAGPSEGKSASSLMRDLFSGFKAFELGLSVVLTEQTTHDAVHDDRISRKQARSSRRRKLRGPGPTDGVAKKSADRRNAA